MRSTDDDVTQPPSARAELEDAVLRSLHEFLAVVQSPLLDGDLVQEELDAQVRTIVGTTIGNLPDVFPKDPDAPAGPPERSLDVGTRRARQGIHPAESLMAANLLYNIALSQFLNRAIDDNENRQTTERVAIALHETITSIVVPASVEYVNVLLERLSVAHSDERFEVSRELHDRVAHGIASALQRLTMLERLGQNPDGPAMRDLVNSIKDLLTDSLDETRSIARELRQFVGEKSLQTALTDYLKDLHIDPGQIQVLETGAPLGLPTGTKEEAFIILRELVTNARQHSSATEIHITLDWTQQPAELAVTDNGHGFELGSVRVGAMGLVSAHERAEIIGGSLRIESTKAGTKVALLLPAKGL